MADSVVVLAKIATLFALIAIGWGSRRRGYLSADATATLGRFVVDVCLPGLILVQMIETVSRDSLRQDWASPVLAVLVFTIAWLVGGLAARLFAPPGSRSTFTFLVGTPNWIYLPLPIAQELWGADGVRAVLLCNVAAQLLLWSVGVALLRQQLFSRELLRKALLNPGIGAAVAGIAIALLIPEARTWRGLDVRQASVALGAAKVALEAVHLLGTVTIPLSLVLIGAQLGGMTSSKGQQGRGLLALAATRLLVAPMLTVAIFHALSTFWAIPPVPQRVAILVSAMPVAVTCGIIVERYGGAVPTAARAIVVTTLASIVSVPFVLYAIVRWGGMG